MGLCYACVWRAIKDIKYKIMRVQNNEEESDDCVIRGKIVKRSLTLF